MATCALYGALLAIGFFIGRQAGRYRTKADLARLTDLIVGGMSKTEDIAIRAELEAP